MTQHKIKMAKESERIKCARRLTIEMVTEMLAEDKTAFQTSKDYGISKSTFHWRVENWVREENLELYRKAKEHLKKTRGSQIYAYKEGRMKL